ncbi:unnamed protein product [Caenorhabditis angaria]|uniref:Serpentine Receptor, class H n=1 Tax=Caenorhabditis angaria TaxID=860376 RepID=A0A9P1IZL5_9PELO|nr:unnamed protein product [Caenorhabditis angaria]
MEIHINIVWEVVVILPQVAICGLGFGKNNGYIMYVIMVYMTVLTGVSAFQLLDYRMKVVTTSHHSRLKFWNYFILGICLASCSICMTTLLAAYPEMTDQISLKLKLQKKFPSFPDVFWCDNCIFLDFDSKYLKVFLIFGIFSAFTGGLYSITTTFISIIGLKSLQFTMSHRTLNLQKNFLWSLFLMTLVHVTFIAIPVMLFFLSHFIYIDEKRVGYIFIMLISQHGSGATLVLILTNTSINNVIKSTLQICCLKFRKSFKCHSRVELQNNVVSFIE